MVKYKSIICGLIAGVALILFYLLVVGILQGFEFAIFNLKSLWYLILPLVIGFGAQIGLYSSIKHDAKIKTAMTGTGAVSAGSMVACCSHFLLNIIPFIGLAGLAGLSAILMSYQKLFLVSGIASSVIGIAFMLNHKSKMKGGFR